MTTTKSPKPICDSCFKWGIIAISFFQPLQTVNSLKATLKVMAARWWHWSITRWSIHRSAFPLASGKTRRGKNYKTNLETPWRITLMSLHGLHLLKTPKILKSRLKWNIPHICCIQIFAFDKMLLHLWLKAELYSSKEWKKIRQREMRVFVRLD